MYSECIVNNAKNLEPGSLRKKNKKKCNKFLKTA